MKKLCTLLLLVLLALVTHAQQPGMWESKGSGITATNRSMQGVSSVDSNTVWGITYPLNDDIPREFTRTVNGGETWNSGIIDPNDGGNYYVLDVFALNADTAWVTMFINEIPYSGRLYITKDGGNSWAQQMGGFNDTETGIIGVHFFNASEGVAYGTTIGLNAGSPPRMVKVWTTSDGGSNWSPVLAPSLPASLIGERLWIHYGSGNYEVVGDTIWFGSSIGRIWRSVDRGKTWEVFNLPFPFSCLQTDACNINSIAFKDAQNGIVVSDAGGFRTTDGGVIWTAIQIPSSITYYQIEYVPDTDGIYFLSFEGSDSYYTSVQHAYSINNGDTWNQVSNPGVECFEFVSSTTAWGGGRINSPTEGGMYKWTGTFGMATSVQKLSDITAYIKLYPNPFTDQTLLEFELKDHSQPVEITITDAIGRQLNTLSLKTPNAGINQIPISVDAPAGLLLLTLKQGTGLKTMRLVKQ